MPLVRNPSEFLSQPSRRLPFGFRLVSRNLTPLDVLERRAPMYELPNGSCSGRATSPRRSFRQLVANPVQTLVRPTMTPVRKAH